MSVGSPDGSREAACLALRVPTRRVASCAALMLALLGTAAPLAAQDQPAAPAGATTSTADTASTAVTTGTAVTTRATVGGTRAVGPVEAPAPVAALAAGAGRSAATARAE